MKRIVTAVVLMTVLAGCSPRLSPLYRDYEVTAESNLENGAVFERIDRGLRAAGWVPAKGITDNILATETRQFREWGLYKIVVDLEIAPVSGDYVRLLVHPYRVYFTGKKSKIPYLRGSLARSVFASLHDEFEKEGLTFIGTAQSRDKAANNF